MKDKILVLCTGNSCRSHMAEGILRFSIGTIFEIYSAGSKPSGFVHPLAIEVMQEIGIDLREHTSKSLDLFLKEKIDTVITVCDHAHTVCPSFPSAKNRYHWSFPDPAKAIGSSEQVKDFFRNVRDQIQNTFSAFAHGYKQGLGFEKPILESL